MTVHFDVIEDDDNNILFVTSAEGNDVIRAPLLNKGTAFSKQERDLFQLQGLIPPHVSNLDHQIEKTHDRYHRLGHLLEEHQMHGDHDEERITEIKKEIDITRYNFLRDLQDRNEILFYALCNRYLEEITPIIYTPTVGQAILNYSRDSSRFRGIFLSPNNISSLGDIFDHFRFKKPTIAVVTDNQGLLGLGDHGVGGIPIPIGKLALYVLGAGIRPWETIPITLDVGTDNPEALANPYYLGYKSGRLRGSEYEEFIEKFISGIKTKFPHILIQWEDFSKQNAFTNLEKYRHHISSFNDDIQGTGSVALAGTLNAMRCSGESFEDQRFVIYGAGAGGIGIAQQLVNCLKVKFNLSEKQALDRIAVLDSKGLITDQRRVTDYKKPFVKSEGFFGSWDVEDSSHIGLLDVVRNFQATALYGTSGRKDHFTDEIIQAMTDNASRPLIFPLSNPTFISEAVPQQIYRVTGGKAIVATGSPFDPFQFQGADVTTGQGNNFFIFPGVGLGAILSNADFISDSVFIEAAYTLSNYTPEHLVARGTVYPPITEIREISAKIALATANMIAREEGTYTFNLKDIKAKMWNPVYPPLIKINR